MRSAAVFIAEAHSFLLTRSYCLRISFYSKLPRPQKSLCFHAEFQLGQYDIHYNTTAVRLMFVERSGWKTNQNLVLDGSGLCCVMLQGGVWSSDEIRMNQGQERNHVFKVRGPVSWSIGITTLLQKKIRQVYPVWCNRLHNHTIHQKAM